MFGLHKGRRGCVLILAGLMSVASIDQGWAQGWSLEREQGVGGSNNAAAQASEPAAPKGGEGLVIIMNDDQPPIIEFSGNNNFVDQLPSETATRGPSNADIPNDRAVGANDLLSIKGDVLTRNSEGATRSSQAVADSVIELNAEDVRLTPPTAVELLGRRQTIKPETAVAALPLAGAPVQAPAKRKVQQAQFAPNTVVAPKAILPPRAGERAERRRRPEPIFLPLAPKAAPSGSCC